MSEDKVIRETRITVDCWRGRLNILGLAFTCIWTAICGGVVVIRRDEETRLT